MSDNLIVEHIYLSFFDEENKNDKMEKVTDVVVGMKDKSTYVSTFYTYDYLKELIKREQVKDRLYWCMNSFTLIAKMEQETIKRTIDKMIECGDFQVMFKKLN